jgi:hypothetical protein
MDVMESISTAIDPSYGFTVRRSLVIRNHIQLIIPNRVISTGLSFGIKIISVLDQTSNVSLPIRPNIISI